MEILSNFYFWLSAGSLVIFIALAVFLCFAAYNLDSDFSKLLGKISIFNLLAGLVVAMTLIVKLFNFF